MLQLRLISGFSLVAEVVRLLKNLMKTELMPLATGDKLTTVWLVAPKGYCMRLGCWQCSTPDVDLTAVRELEIEN